ncbi:nicotinamide riboside kinase 1-like protein, partial [Dinothrombium tinctorium]
MEINCKKKTKIIGISGVTCGGKTYLSEALKRSFVGSVIVNQDDYFREEDDPCHEWIDVSPVRKHQNWETLSSIDWSAFSTKISDILNGDHIHETGLILIEGHIIFNYDKFPFSFDRKYFVTLNKDECWQRRNVREYIPKDPDGYFDVCVWP